MTITRRLFSPKRFHLAQIVVAVAGVGYLLAGAALLIAPEAFFRYIGPYPPFNRHYEGDLGSFLLPLGIALLIASSAPPRHLSLIWFASLASALHAVNHIAEAVERATITEWLVIALPLTAFAVALVWCARVVSSIETTSPSS